MHRSVLRRWCCASPFPCRGKSEKQVHAQRSPSAVGASRQGLPRCGWAKRLAPIRCMVWLGRFMFRRLEAFIRSPLPPGAQLLPDPQHSSIHGCKCKRMETAIQDTIRRCRKGFDDLAVGVKVRGIIVNIVVGHAGEGRPSDYEGHYKDRGTSDTHTRLTTSLSHSRREAKLRRSQGATNVLKLPKTEGAAAVGCRERVRPRRHLCNLRRQLTATSATPDTNSAADVGSGTGVIWAKCVSVPKATSIYQRPANRL